MGSYNDSQEHPRIIFRTRATLPVLPDPTIPAGTACILLDEDTILWLKVVEEIQQWMEIAGDHASQADRTIYVSPAGKDTNPGTLAKPVKTLLHALDVRPLNAGDVTIQLAAGTYDSPSTTFNPYQIGLSGNKPGGLGQGAVIIKGPDLTPIGAGSTNMALTGASAGANFTVTAATVAKAFRGAFLRLEDGSGIHLRIIDNDGAGNIQTLGGFGPIAGTVRVTVVKATARVNGFVRMAGPGFESQVLAWQCVDLMSGDLFKDLNVLKDRVTTYTNATPSYPAFEGSRADVFSLDPLAPPTSDAITYIADETGTGGGVNVQRSALMSSPLLALFCYVQCTQNSTMQCSPFVLKRSPYFIIQGSDGQFFGGDSSSAVSGITGIQTGDTYQVEGGTVVAGTDFSEACGAFGNYSSLTSYGCVVDGNQVGGMRIFDNASSDDDLTGHNANFGRSLGGSAVIKYAIESAGLGLYGTTPGTDDVQFGFNTFSFTGGTLRSYAFIAASNGAEQSLSDHQGNVITQQFP